MQICITIVICYFCKFSLGSEVSLAEHTIAQ